MWKNGRATKRRCSSPRYFPRKVHISEEKVAEELGNLCIGVSQRNKTSLQDVQSKANFFMDGGKTRTFREIEDSLDIEEDDTDIEPAHIELAPELVREIRKLKRKILVPGTYRPAKKPLNSCQELMLWQPPSGAVGRIMEIINNVTPHTNKNCEAAQKKPVNGSSRDAEDGSGLSHQIADSALSDYISAFDTGQTFRKNMPVDEVFANQPFLQRTYNGDFVTIPEPRNSDAFFKPIQNNIFGVPCKIDFDECEMEL